LFDSPKILNVGNFQYLAILYYFIPFNNNLL